MSTQVTPSRLDPTKDFSSLVPSAFEKANTALAQANAAFAQANNSTDTWVRTQANNAYNAANSAALFANGSFVTANSAASFSNGSFVVANSASIFANGAFDRANAAFNSANNATDPWVRTQANNAYNQANSSASFANGAFIVANSSAIFANVSFDRANASYAAQNTTASFANAAFTKANSEPIGTSAASFANSAFDRANAAYAQANTGGGGGASSVNTYISLAMSGVITTPYIGTSRFYPPANVSLSMVYANLSTAASSGNFTFIIKKNGTSIGNTFTITQNQTVMTPANVSVSLTTTDYLTLDVNGANATDLFVRIKYTNT